MKKGFTLIELLISIVLISLLLAAAVPFSVNFLRREQLQSTEENLITVLRKAQSKAIDGEQDRGWGVRFHRGRFILFAQGSTTYNEDYDYPTSINISAPQIIFQKLSGATTPVTLTLSNSLTSETITINAQGLIE